MSINELGGPVSSGPKENFTQKGQSVGSVPAHLPREAAGTYRASRSSGARYSSRGSGGNAEGASFRAVESMASKGAKYAAEAKHPLFKEVHVQLKKMRKVKY